MRIKLSELKWFGVKKYARRLLLIIFKPLYVMESLSQRKEQCNRCGCCTNWCKSYKHPKCLRKNNMPFMCKLFPIDEKDIGDFKGKCSFYWVRKRE